MNNVWAEYKFLQDFTLRVSYTTDNYNTNLYEYTPTFNYVPVSDQKPNKLITRDSRNRNYIWDNTLSWKKSLGDHNLEILAGFSRTRNSYSQTYLEALNVNYDGTNASMNIFNGTNIIMVDYDREGFDVVPYQDRIESMFARVNYDYKGKYLVNGSVRRDGTSKYSSGDRHRVFPAVSAGWVISKENFMSDQNVFSLLKLRASWGKLGNPDVTRAYTLRTTILKEGAYYGNSGAPAQTIDRVIDPNIGWETTTGRDIGLEMGLFNNKLKIDATYFDKDTKDVVYGVTQGTVSGASNWRNFVTNAYSFNNRGFEVSVNYDTKISDNVKLGVYGNLTTLKINYICISRFIPRNRSKFIWKLYCKTANGQSVGAYYGYEVTGVFQTDAEAAASGQTGAKQDGLNLLI
ncbi:hypothetical protein EJ377_18385 [Chryseobacterium arthrosphaerae]|uniref:Uncharacterized protein n=1 Tax=Chryseobacterium arthrosphaerae TaxID=651561 RepID=A0A3S0Q4D7_9FLAO|nr:hypothetical protein EJ377_18385 [Chryseobacterium arthrosphaerae]